MSDAKHTAEPYNFDGHGINDANGQRLAKMSECGTIPKYLEDSRTPNPEFERVGNMLAASPKLLTMLKLFKKTDELDWYARVIKTYEAEKTLDVRLTFDELEQIQAAIALTEKDE